MFPTLRSIVPTPPIQTLQQSGREALRNEFSSQSPGQGSPSKPLVLYLALLTGLFLSVPLPAAAQRTPSQFPGGTVGGGTRGGSGSASANQWPGNRVGGGTRAPSCINFPEGFETLSVAERLALQQDPRWNLVALMPSSNLGETVAEYPTLFWYIPPTHARYLEFSLHSTRDGLYEDQLIYRASLRITGEAGIASLTLPQDAGVPPLAVGESYLWSLQLVCESDDETRDPALVSDLGGSAFTVSGVIQRIETDLLWSRQVERSDPSTQVRLYLEEGIWWDALDSMTTVYCEASASNDGSRSREFADRWQQVLDSVGLAEIADQNILHRCPAVSTPNVSISPVEGESRGNAF